ncbi:nucleotidyltransferase [Candidatus Saganbacteria bacterium]|nr:nucleotidyltransferase [Candidatus Saganbacteria bacterium]
MDFEKVFQLLLSDFAAAQISFALIGGFALASWGYPRSTLDIDFLLDKNDLFKVKELMSSYGYNIGHESEESISFQGGLVPLGRVDFLLAHRHYTLAMLKRAVTGEILGGRFKIKIVGVEDLIGLKVQASSNDRERYLQDMVDIENLIKENYSSIKFELIKEYFNLFERDQELQKILEGIKNAK